METKRMFFLGIIALSLWMGCNGKTFQATWIEKAIEIDGNTVDWQGGLVALEDPPVGIGAKQDSAYLYLCFVTQDESLMRELGGRGMVLWMEAEGKKSNKIGIKYPIGMMGGPSGNRGNMKMDREPPQGGKTEKGNFPQMTFADAAIKLPDMDDFESYKSAELEIFDIYATIKETDGLFVYELKVPLTSKDSKTIALGKDRPSKVKLVFEEQEMERKEFGEESGSSRGPGMGGGPGGGGRPPGGMGGGGGMPPSGGGPGGGPGGPEESESFSLKCTIILQEAQN